MLGFPVLRRFDRHRGHSMWRATRLWDGTARHRHTAGVQKDRSPLPVRSGGGGPVMTDVPGGGGESKVWAEEEGGLPAVVLVTMKGTRTRQGLQTETRTWTESHSRFQQNQNRPGTDPL